MSAPPLDLSYLATQGPYPALIDIGANDGAFGAYLAGVFGTKTVHAFEPQPFHAQALRARGFTVHPLALGAATGEGDLALSEADGASSLLALTDLCTGAYPQTRVVGRVRVPVRPLDAVLDPIPGAVVKIDVQGAEREVLAGGRAVIGAAALVLLEASFAPLYAGQALFGETHAQMDALGFALTGVRNQHLHPETGRPLFAHLLYERQDAPHGPQG